MSWMKRGGTAPPPTSGQQAYAAAQPYGNQQNMFPNYQGAPPGQQQQTWQMPQHQQAQYNQQYGQVYQQQPYVNNTSQFFQQPQQPQQYNQNYANQNFDNTQQVYQQNYYHNQQQQQQKNFSANEGNADGWEDNWNWGWEDSAKQHQKSLNQAPPAQQAFQPQSYNNANMIEESFAPTNSWNWSMEEKKEAEVQPTLSQSILDNQENAVHIDNSNNDNSIINEPNSQRSASNISALETKEEVRNLSDKEIVKEALPDLALGKRFNLENLTPQWSIESQMSQDSSDGPHTQSEGTYRSENHSRNSSKSSPGPNPDPSNFICSQSGFNEMNLPNSEWSKNSTDESMLVSNMQNNNRRTSCDDLANSVQEINISNHENMSSDIEHIHKVENIEDNTNNQTIAASIPSVSPNPMISNQFIPHPSMPPPPPVSTQCLSSNSSVPSISATSNTLPSQTLPPTNIAPSSSIPPPTSLPPLSSTMPPTASLSSSASQNPFKSGTPFSHKNMGKIQPLNPQPQSFASQNPGQNLQSPAVVNKVVQQDRLSANFGANLETTPDNSERPDQPQVTSYRTMPLPTQVPDNLEIAPQNDRNEYLQTAHLSSVDYGENTDFSRNIPPPGLRRMGVGQQEVEYSQNLNISGDEPPPGLARMVPGQQTETDNSYNQVGDNYMDRQIDGQPTDGSGRPYRQADGQQTPDNYSQSVASRGVDRRPVGLDRMVPGEPSNDEYPQYQTSTFAQANEHRVVTGVDHDYPISTDAGPSDIREQNVDGSDYTEPTPRNPSRSIIGAREASNATSPDFSLSVDDQQREITMEGENLQDLSVVSSADISFSREAAYDGSNANIMEATKDRNHDSAEVTEYPTNNSRRQSLNRVTSGEDSERDRAYKASPRKDRDKTSRDRDRDRDRDKERGRHSRGDKKYDRESERRSGRDERRSDKDRRTRDRDWERQKRDKDESPEVRRHRRSTRSHRYETEDTDCYSDREKSRRQYREGSYTSSKPPREDKDRERRRYNTQDRERYEERSRRSDRPRDRELDRERDRDWDRFERRYRDIEPRKYASLRKEREDDRRKVVTFSGDAKTDNSKYKGEAYSSGSRAGSREATATDDEEPRRRRHRHRHYYEEYAAGAGAEAGAGAGAWAAQRRQYEYYERLRRSDPAAYMRLYKQLLAPGLYGDGYGSLGYEARTEERGSVHSGRSSANGLKPTDTYYGARGGRDAASLRTDCSDRELTTDMSLNLHLEESTVRSERMTPFKYSTAHVKGVLGARSLVLVVAGWPADGRAAPLQLLPLARLLPDRELARYPGPLLKGATHKKSVVEYCEARARDAGRRGGADVVGYALLWDLLALMLRQNGVVVGTDIAELLMKNTKEFEYQTPSDRTTERVDSPEEQPLASEPDPAVEEEENSKTVIDEKEALDRFREYLIYGNRQEALEYAMERGLWAHALQLAAASERRVRGAVCARFVGSLASTDPLRSLYAALAARSPPALAGADDWRPHAAILLANGGARPDHDRRLLAQLGDTLGARGLLYSAQFCYLSAGEPFAPHPLEPLRPAPPSPPAAPPAPPRLSLLLADPQAPSLAHFATNQAIFATEIYEYALSLSSAQQDYVLDELTVYKLVLATRLADAGQCERALRYTEQAARALTRSPRRSAARALAIASLADRLQYCEPALQEEPEEGGSGEEEAASAEQSPRRRQWLRDLHAVADQLSAEATQQNTPQHHSDNYIGNIQQTQWDQTLQPHQQIQQYQPNEPVEDTPDYATQYYQPQLQPQQHQQYHQQSQHQQLVPEPVPEQQQQQQQQYDQQYGYEEHGNSYADPYWQNDTYYGYQEGAETEAESRPTITMPGAPRRADRPPSPGAPQNDLETDSSKANGKDPKKSSGEPKGDKRGGGAGGGGGGGGGWLGGILTKLSLRAPNQMILPDDTNPTIVWDEQHKCWRDTAAPDGDAPPAAPPAPPRHAPAPSAAPLSTSTPLQSPGTGAAPPAAPMSNIFKMQKGRHIKKSYVDVLNPGGARAPAAPLPAPPAPPTLAPAPPAGYFVPAPAHAQQTPKPVQVSIPSSPEDSPHLTPTSPLPKGGIYDPTQVAAAEEDYRSGI